MPDETNETTSKTSAEDLLGQGLRALHQLHASELGLVRSAINDLLATVKEQTDAKDRAEAFALLIRQLREANQHLVEATFGARDLQASAEATTLRQIEFLSMLAHELRNPLQPIAMANDMLAKVVDLHPSIARVHGINERQIAHMVRLIDDLLDGARVSSGKIGLELDVLDVAAIVADAVETARGDIDRRRQNLRVDLPHETLVVEGDLSRLSQVLSNLLINASKFTPDMGNITVSAGRTNGQVEITISDDGAGIPKALQPFIFDLFTQGPASRDRKSGGLGIGLSLVRTITELHRGKCTVFSAGAGTGSPFTVLLPSSTLPLTITTAASHAHALPCTILIIEDNEDAVTTLAMLLRELGHTVATRNDGISGVEQAIAQRYALVICDIGLPGLDGFDVVRALRLRLQAPFPCFVAMTGYSDPLQRALANQAGFDHYLVKPVQIAQLSEIIAALATPPAPLPVAA